MLKAPDGFTHRGMPKGWMRAKQLPAVQRLKAENTQLKETIAAILGRLDRMEKQQCESC